MHIWIQRQNEYRYWNNFFTLYTLDSDRNPRISATFVGSLDKIVYSQVYELFLNQQKSHWPLQQSISNKNPMVDDWNRSRWNFSNNALLPRESPRWICICHLWSNLTSNHWFIIIDRFFGPLNLGKLIFRSKLQKLIMWKF